MKAVCVNADRELELRDIPLPPPPAPGYVTIEVAAAAINHGDKTFLKLPEAAGGMRGERLHGVWGASAAGVVTAIGDGVPARYLGRKVATYRSLQPDLPFLGTWCEVTQLSYRTCLPLPDDADLRAYSGSLVNVVTAYAFLEQALAEGHRGVLATAGNSATARALEALAVRRGIPVVTIVREGSADGSTPPPGATRLTASASPEFLTALEQVARDRQTTAVFDGVGGGLVGRILPALPDGAAVSFYGFLSGAEQVSFHSALFMAKNLTMRRFSNYDSAILREADGVSAMLRDLEDVIAGEAYRTPVGKVFDLAAFDAAMAYRGPGRAVFVPARA